MFSDDDCVKSSDKQHQFATWCEDQVSAVVEQGSLQVSSVRLVSSANKQRSKTVN